jgi:DNA-binding MarR family transcriptional regulator
MIANPEKLARQIFFLPEILQRKLERNILKIVSAELNLNLAAYHVLTLAVLQNEGALSVNEIGEQLAISRSQMTFCLDRLYDLGVIQRQPDAADRRKIMIELTLRGRWVADEITKACQKSILTRLASLSDEDLGQLENSFDLLERLVKIL